MSKQLNNKRIAGRNRTSYRDYYTLKNLNAVRAGSVVFLILNVILRILYYVFPESLTRAQNYPEFNYTNWLYIAITPLFLAGSYGFAYLYKNKKADMVMGLFVFGFAFYIIFCGMYSSFIATSDPRNALTLYLTALSIISVVFVFETVETLLLIVITEVVFTYLLYYTAAEPMEMVYNQIISITLLFCFYFIARYFYSYKMTYFMQLADIREKNIAIEKGNAFKNEILGMVAHDLRNPIGAIETISMMMEMEDNMDADTRENIDMIKASCIKARGIIADLLDAANNENINIIDTQRTEMNHFLKRIINEWKVQKDAKNSLVFIGSKNQVFAEINGEKFQRVIDNLISNALKFSKDHGKIDIYLSEKDGQAVVEVRDYGLGIPPDMLPHIFERFSKARRPGVHGEQSTGLGLSISKQIIENHKGTIEVMSEERKGSTFTIKVPEVE